ncbi:hypothetical protein AGMMS49982_14390 [Bacteroidia bacterium]|nr:hypothetical protein AGMMS49982_14390 [Bacteroidia bacterium]
MFFFFVRNYTFGGQEHPCDGGGIFQRHARHLRGVDDTLFAEVFVGIGAGVVAEITFAPSNKKI